MKSITRILAVAALLTLPSTAFADWATVWIAAKSDYVNGTGDLFKRFDNRVGYGVEGGVELFAIDVFGEALLMGSDQFFFTGNVGLDFAAGEDFRVVTGIFTGPVFFLFPEGEGAGGVNCNRLTTEESQTLQDLGQSCNEIATEFAQYAGTEEDLSRTGFGWNLARLRINLEYAILPVLYIGGGAQVAYHMLISGEEAAAGAKNDAINDYVGENPELAEARDTIAKAVGAEEVDEENLDGLNYQFGLYLKLEL